MNTRKAHLGMIKASLLVFTLTGLLTNSISQNCLPDGITFERQAQIDSFPILYPGCTQIDGAIVIQELS
ncbi:MAG TPA: hypothetical protein VGK46_06455, partial [Saprospiraceae bacterium]